MLPIRYKGGFFVFFLFGVVLHWHLFGISPENGLYRHVLSLGKPSHIADLVVRLVIVRLYDYKSCKEVSYMPGHKEYCIVFRNGFFRQIPYFFFVSMFRAILGFSSSGESRVYISTFGVSLVKRALTHSILMSYRGRKSSDDI